MPELMGTVRRDLAILARDLPLLLQRARRVTADVTSRVDGSLEMVANPAPPRDENASSAHRRELAAREQLSEFLEHLELSPVKRYSAFPDLTESAHAELVRSGLMQLDQRMWETRCQTDRQTDRHAHTHTHTLLQARLRMPTHTDSLSHSLRLKLMRQKEKTPKH